MYFLVLALAAACSPSKEEPEAGDGGSEMDAAAMADDSADVVAAPAVDCTNGPPLDPFGPELAIVGTAKALSFALVRASPGQPATAFNVWNVRVEDMRAVPVVDATLTVTTWMPRMHHGSSVKPQIANNGDGTYTISQLYFQMTGIWQVTVSAGAAATSDNATITFCVDQ